MRVLVARPPIAGLPREQVRWPAALATACAVLRERGLEATLVDAQVTGESVGGFVDRLRGWPWDLVALAVGPDDLPATRPILAEAAGRVPTVALWSGDADTAAALLNDGLAAVVRGEPEMGLLAAALIGERTVYPPDPVRCLDELPRAWRDYTVHLYRHGLAGPPEGPPLSMSVGRGDRWRSLDAVADEIAFCRHNWPRLTHLWLVDDDLVAGGDRFVALAERLNRAGWPWCADLADDEIIATADGAAALRIHLTGEPDDSLIARLRALSRAGVALTLRGDGELTRLAADVGARVEQPAEVDLPVAAAMPARRRPVYIVGCLQPVYMGAGLLQAAREAGHPAVGIDVYDDPANILRLLEAPRDAVAILDRGTGIPADLLEAVPARTVLYSPEVLPTLERSCSHAEQRYAEFAPKASRVDDVVLHDAHPWRYLESRGHDNLRGVVPLPVDTRRFRDRRLARTIDVVFVGSPSDHRRRWLEHLAAGGIEVTCQNVWGDAFVELLNRAKIVLNLHFAPLPNTELRIAEALACGCFVVTEPITEPAAFRDGEHVVSLGWDTAADQIRWWLDHPAERAAVAAAGRAVVAEQHTCARVLEKILALSPEAA